MRKTIIPTWLGRFYGDDLTQEEYECKTLAHFPPSLRKTESRLFNTKWFDYRRLHPLQATYYFVDCYKKRTKFFYERFVGQAIAQKTKGVKKADFLDGKEASSFWRLRQLVDSMGVEYVSFFQWMEAFFASYPQKDNYYPRPYRFFLKDKELWLALRQDFYEAPEIHFAKDPFFTPERFCGHAYQLEYEKYIVRKILTKQVRQADILSSAMYRKNALRLEAALLSFPYSVVKEAVMRPSLPLHLI